MKKIVICRAVILSVVLLASCPALSFGQEQSPIDFSVQLKNMHLWRGLEVASSTTFATDIHLTDRRGEWTLGLWGGAAIDGSFKEFDYYASYSNSGFTLALWDIYNFSPGATYNNREVFNYKARETGHFIDLSVAYRFGGDCPLQVKWATIIHGRDRGFDNEQNLYSTFVTLDCPVVRDKAVDVAVGIGGAFALKQGENENGDRTNNHFYGSSPGIMDINLTLSKVLHIGSYELPAAVMTMWNPDSNYANIQLTLNLF